MKKCVGWAFVCGLNVGWFFDYETLTSTDWSDWAQWPIVPMAGAALALMILRDEIQDLKAATNQA